MHFNLHFVLGSGQTKTLVLRGARVVTRECPSVSTAAPGVQTGQQVVFGNQNWALRSWEPSRNISRYVIGRSPVVRLSAKTTQSATVAVLGDTARK